MLAWILTALVTVWGVLLGGIGFLAWRFYRVEPGDGPAEGGDGSPRSDGRRWLRQRGRGRRDHRRRRTRTGHPTRRIPRKVVL